MEIFVSRSWVGAVKEIESRESFFEEAASRGARLVGRPVRVRSPPQRWGCRRILWTSISNGMNVSAPLVLVWLGSFPHHLEVLWPRKALDMFIRRLDPQIVCMRSAQSFGVGMVFLGVKRLNLLFMLGVRGPRLETGQTCVGVNVKVDV